MMAHHIVALAAGEYLHVSVEQRGVDLMVTLRDPTGAMLSEMDGLQWPSDMEELSYEAANTGRYVVEVRANGQPNNNGSYELRIQRSETTNQQGRARIVAERLYMEATRLTRQARGAGLEQAIKKYEEAIQQWRAAGVRKWEGQSLNGLGNAYRNLNRYEQALEYYDRALVIMREIKEKDREGSVLYNLGFAYTRLAQYEKAQSFLEQALAIWHQIGNRTGEALALNSLGIVHWRLKKHETARECYERALVIRRETGDRNARRATHRSAGFSNGQRDRGTNS